MAARKITRRIVRIVGIPIAVLMLLIAAFHFWFISHAESILENLVESKSNGKLKLKVKKFKFNYFSTKMELENAVFYTTDTVNSPTAYRFSVANIKIRVNALLPIIFRKQIRIDSLALIKPDIRVLLLKKAESDPRTSKKEFSIPHEMGRVYNSIRDALDILQVKRFQIEDAKFSLINKVHPEQPPLIITNIFFHINNITIDSTEEGKEKILFGENAVIRNRHQDILFPDGRHRLSYSRFRINLRKRLVEFDSCTMAAVKTDSSSASFKVFFDTLLLTNIDFDTLYHYDVIKADSVYCLNPKFELDVKLGKKTTNKPSPKFDKIIEQLTGDLQLGFVIVHNASVNINTERNDRPSSFTSDHNNFEIQGLSVDEEAEHPVKIKSFAMAIRNYENFLGDSSYSLRFDSILFNDDRIALSNFTLRQLNQRGKSINSFRMPQFQLRGISWEDFVFDRRLSANEATLYHPIIDYSVKAGPQKKKQDIFSTLGSLANVLQLDQLYVVDGKINLGLQNNTQLELQDASISIKSQALLNSKKVSEIKNSVNELYFKHGLIKTVDLSIDLDDVHYSGTDSILSAGKLFLNNKQKNLSATGEGLVFKKILVDDKTGDIDVGALQWKQADIHIKQETGQNKNTFSSAIVLNNIRGNNTMLTASFGNKLLTTFIETISFDKLIKQPQKKITIENPYATGKNIKVADESSLLTINNYKISDNKNSLLQNILYKSFKGDDSVDVSIPTISFVPDMQTIMKGKLKTDNVNIETPVANIKLSSVDSATSSSKFPVLDINRIYLSQPEINFRQLTPKGTVRLQWNGQAEKNNYLELTDINSTKEKISTAATRFTFNHFIFTGHKGKSINAGSGEIMAQLKNFNIDKSEDDQWHLTSFVQNISATHFIIDSIGKRIGKLDLDKLQLENLSIRSSSLNSSLQFADDNALFELKEFSGQYNNTISHFGWFNAGFDRKNKTFSADSFVFHPTLNEPEFVITHYYQTDYLRTKTGKIVIEGFDPGVFFRDSIIKIQTAKIDEVSLTDFRDNRPPFHAGIIKPLPAQLLQKIPFKVSIDTLLLTNTNTVYSELNNKTLQLGVVPVTRMTIRAFPIKNYDLKSSDTIRIQATGYLMDSIWIRLRIRESYLDSLSGFLMTVRMKPARLQVLNTVFEPLSSVKILSGYLDTLSLRAIGKDYFAYGEMKMLYHDLKIKFLVNGSEVKKGFLNGLKTFVANSFLIKNKNVSRSGRVFFLRNRERSSLNYIVKIAMSGIASSVGARSNRKILNKYKKQLQLRNLPPFDYD